MKQIKFASMKELRTILMNFRRLSAEGVDMAMATVVRVRGSAYRRPGARMLIAESGHFAGSVSGGCLEEDTMKRAREVMTTGIPQLISFDTRLNSKDAVGMGYGCNGLLDVLIEPVHSQGLSMQWLDRSLWEDFPVGIATVFASSDDRVAAPGARIYRRGDTVETEHISDNDLVQEILTQLDSVVLEGLSSTDILRWKGTKIEVLHEVIQPTVQLLIYGAVFHTVPVKKIAEDLGWNVVVRDDPSTNTNLMDFPGSEDLVIDADAAEQKLLNQPGRLAVLFLTHNFMHIIERLKVLLPLDPAYIGILGSRKKTGKILRTLQDDGFVLTDGHLSKLYYPVGLDIGGDKPESIALSVVAEIHAVTHGRKGGFLRDKSGAIHPRSPKADH